MATTSPRERIEAALEQVATMLAEESRHIDVAGAIASRFADIRDAARELAMNQAFYADMKKAQAERDRLAEVVELQKGQNADLRETLENANRLRGELEAELERARNEAASESGRAASVVAELQAENAELWRQAKAKLR